MHLVVSHENIKNARYKNKNKYINTLFLLAHLRNAAAVPYLPQPPPVLLVFSLYPSITLSVPLSCCTNPLQSPFHPKLKLLILNKSVLSNKCTGLSKSLCASDDYSTKNTQKMF
jgi:hypothetical protein